MPMLVRLRRLFKASPSSRALGSTFAAFRPTQHPSHWPDSRPDVGVQHHERQPPVALQRILLLERNDRLLLPILQPKIPGTQPLCSLTLPYRPRQPWNLLA